MSTQFQGLDEVLNSLEELVDEEKFMAALGKACALVERSAKQNAPKDTGALRRSITSEVEKNGTDIVGVVYTPLEYAPYVEYGTGLFAEQGGRQDVPWNYQDDEGNWHSTSGQKPQPFMQPALNDNRERILRIIKEGLSND
jgi:HK97 gp10 family phage protein